MANVPEAKAVADAEAGGGGTTAQAAPAGGRRPLTRSEAARHASLVRWGKEQPFAARLAAIREARKGRKAGKGRAAAKPKKTPEQRAAERDVEKQRIYNETADALEQQGAIGKNDLGSLSEFASGNDIKPEAADKLVAAGLMERGTDGTPRLTAHGNKLLSSAERGDVRGALDALSRGKDAAGREAARQQKEAEKQQKKGGGGGGGKQKPNKAGKQAQMAAQTAPKVGLKPDTVRSKMKRKRKDYRSDGTHHF